MKNLIMIGILVRLITCESLFFERGTHWKRNGVFLNINSGAYCCLIGQVQSYKVVSVSKCYEKPTGAELIN